MCDLHETRKTSDDRRGTIDVRRPSSVVLRPSSIVLEYADLLGKQYLHNGRGPDHYDCWGLCMEIYKRLGLGLPEFLPQSPDPACIHTIVAAAVGANGRSPLQSAKFIEISKPEPYCLVSFMVRPPYVTHVGVVLEDVNKFIHLMRKSRVTVERLDLWAKRVKGFYIYVLGGAKDDRR